MEEKFSVSLELMIQKFKDNAKKVQTVAQNVASKIKENMSVNVDGGSFVRLGKTLKIVVKQAEYLKVRMNDIKYLLEKQTWVMMSEMYLN